MSTQLAIEPAWRNVIAIWIIGCTAGEFPVSLRHSGQPSGTIAGGEEVKSGTVCTPFSRVPLFLARV